MPAETIGSVGTLVGASLETVGHYLQSKMISLLGGEFGTSLLMFIYVLACLSIILSFAFTGQYRGWVSLFLGPALFGAAVTATIPSAGVRWESGSRTYESRYVWEAVQGAAPQEMLEENRRQNPSAPQREVRVSWFFAKWDNLVSSVVQTFVAALQLSTAKGGGEIGDKIALYNRVMNLSPVDPGLQKFLQLAVSFECGSYFALQRDYSGGITNQIQQARIKQQIDAQRGRLVYEVTDDVRNWIRSINFTEYLENLHQQNGGNRKLLSCDQVWGLAAEISKYEAIRQINDYVQNNIKPGVSPEDKLRNLEEKFQYKVVDKDGTIQPLDPNQRLILAVNEIAGRILLQQLKELKPDIIGMNMEQLQVPGGDGARTQVSRGLDLELRQLQATEAQEEKTDFFVSVMSLSYIQGMLLYFLAATYPFFGLALVLPGKHGAFLNWLGLWVWVKSWDFGFELVKVAENLLYALLPHGDTLTGDQLRQPEVAMKILLEVDPTYTVHTYYNLLAVCMVMVPVATGAVVKKGGGYLVDMVSESLSNFSGRTGFAAAAYARTLLGNTAVAKAQNHIVKKGELAIRSIFQSKEFLGAFAKRNALIAAKSVAESRGGAVSKVAVGALNRDIAMQTKIMETVFASKLEDVKAALSQDPAIQLAQRELALNRGFSYELIALGGQDKLVDAMVMQGGTFRPVGDPGAIVGAPIDYVQKIFNSGANEAANILTSRTPVGIVKQSVEAGIKGAAAGAVIDAAAENQKKAAAHRAAEQKGGGTPR